MEAAYCRVRETGVDGVLLGRAAQGNPWIFRAKDQVKQALRFPAELTMLNSPFVDLEERFRVLLEHSRYFEKTNIIRNFVGMRKHLAWYCCNSPGAAELRAQMVRVNCTEDVIQCLGTYVGRLGSQFEPAGPVLRKSDSSITDIARRSYETHSCLHVASPS
jgi:tRNA-dihydrouridine synthase